MRKFLVAMAVSLGMLAVVESQSTPATPQSVEGVWKGVSVVVTGPGGYTIPNRLPMMIIYTKKHYSVLAQDADGRQTPRQVPPPLSTPGKPTDAEKIARYEFWAPVVADAGTYELRGSTLIQRQIVNKDGPPIERTREIAIEDGGGDHEGSSRAACAGDPQNVHTVGVVGSAAARQGEIHLAVINL
jgi:hypothetical protein